VRAGPKIGDARGMALTACTLRVVAGRACDASAHQCADARPLRAATIGSASPWITAAAAVPCRPAAHAAVRDPASRAVRSPPIAPRRGNAGMHRDGLEAIRVAQTEHGPPCWRRPTGRRPRRARGSAPCLRAHLVDCRNDRGGFGQRAAGSPLEPVPAALCIGETILLRAQNDEALRAARLQMRVLRGDCVGVLRTAVQQHDERQGCRPACSGRLEQAVASPAGDAQRQAADRAGRGLAARGARGLLVAALRPACVARVSAFSERRNDAANSPRRAIR